MKTGFLAVLLSLGGYVLGQGISDLDIHELDRTELDPVIFPDLGSRRVLAKYGPFSVPGVHDPDTGGMKEFTGIVEMPCADCYLVSLHASLVFDDDTVANANTGMWLHHTVFMNANQSDAVCPDFPSRFWGSGNERVPTDLSNNGTQKAGIYIGPEDIVLHSTELMNESANKREAYLDIYIEYIPAAEAKAASFRPITVLWLDIDGLCSQDSQIEITDDMAAAGSFEREVEEGWKIPYDAEILNVYGHLHDGGLKQEITVNGKVVCEHTAEYGGSAEFITHVGMYGNEDQEGGDEGHDHAGEESEENTNEEGEENGHSHGEEEHGHGEEEHSHGEGQGEGHTHGEGEGEEHTHEEGEGHTHDEGEGHEGHDHGSDAHITHISNITWCTEPTRLSAGDVLSIKSYYDISLHPPMAGHHAGSLEPVMGISFVNILRDETEE